MLVITLARSVMIVSVIITLLFMMGAMPDQIRRMMTLAAIAAIMCGVAYPMAMLNAMTGEQIARDEGRPMERVMKVNVAMGLVTLVVSTAGAFWV